jgi:ubiquinone/menaquinone biosynthesis C-methylase UbiE
MMHLFKMKGSWDAGISFFYDHIVASGIGELYDDVVENFFRELPAGCRVLDLGCGSGQVSIRVAKLNPLAQVVGIDLSPSQIARAKKRGAGLPNLSFLVGDAMNAPQPNESFDLVVSLASIKHWPDPVRGLREMRRVCRGDGRLYVIEVNARCTEEEARDFTDRWRHVPPGTRAIVRWHFRRFVAGQGATADELAGLMREAGMGEVYVQIVPGQPLLIATGLPAN